MAPGAGSIYSRPKDYEESAPYGSGGVSMEEAPYEGQTPAPIHGHPSSRFASAQDWDRTSIPSPAQLLGWATFAASVGQIGGRDYGLLGEAINEDKGKIRNPGRIREWAVVAAVILAACAVLSWPNTLFLVVFVAAAAACAILAAVVHFSRPVVETE